MRRDPINPWRWQDAFGFVQANLVSGVERTVYCSGQLAVDSEGRPQHANDMAAQVELAIDNLEMVLRESGLKLSDVVRLNYYTTDVDGFIAAGETLGRRLAAGNCQPASTLLGVARLAFPESLIEIEATAVA